MLFASIINCPKHISPKSAASLLVQDWKTMTGLCGSGYDERGFEGRNLETIENYIYTTNLPAC
jgi:hypothetical protein